MLSTILRSFGVAALLGGVIILASFMITFLAMAMGGYATGYFGGLLSAAGVPMLAVVATQVPLRELIKWIVGAIF